jgi:cytochrome b561
LFETVYGGRGTLPPDLWVYPIRSLHYLISRLLMALIALHITGALYHTFVLKDGLLRRMAFGRRVIVNQAANRQAIATTVQQTVAKVQS